MAKSNLHTHTVYCDGKNTPEELVLEAISKGAYEIGFSGHSFSEIPDEEPFCMSVDNTKLYREEILKLKEKYKSDISIYLGIEQDYFSKINNDDYDYVIGSVHYIKKDGVYISIDANRETLIKSVEKYYNGDYYSLIEEYYKLVGDIFEKTQCNIVGHFDLVTKFNEDNLLFDTNHPRYIKAADTALKKLLKHNVAFEINHGAVSRGHRTTPYPEKRLIEKIKKAGNPLVNTSDCHKKEYLFFGIPDDNIDFKTILLYNKK